MAHAHGQAVTPTPSGSRRTRKQTLRYVDDVIGEAYLQLHRGNLEAFLALHRSAGVTPKKDRLVSWARRALWRGELESALRAFSAAGVTPMRDDLLACSVAAQERGDQRTAQCARLLAQKS